MRILSLSLTFPYPPCRGGTQIRTFHLLKALAQHHEITLLTQQSPTTSETDLQALQASIGTVIPFPPKGSQGGSTGAMTSGGSQAEQRSGAGIGLDRSLGTGLGTGLGAKLERWGTVMQRQVPPNILHYWNPNIQAWVDTAIAQGQFDVITAEHSVNELYVRPEWRDRLPSLLNIHSSNYRTLQSRLESPDPQRPRQTLRDRALLPLMRRYEQRTYGKFSHLVVTTPDDQAVIRELLPTYGTPIPTSIIANGVDLQEFSHRPRDPGGHTLILTGNFDYFVNIDAARCLALKIFPQVQQRYPQARLLLVGARPDPSVEILSQNPGITVTGRVPSLATVLHQADIFVAPLQSGFGIKNKTLEAMAAGVPVVGSDRALEGLIVDQPRRALRANHPNEAIAAICQLFEDAPLRQQLTQAARHYIEAEFTWEQAGEQYNALIESLPGHSRL